MSHPNDLSFTNNNQPSTEDDAEDDELYLESNQQAERDAVLHRANELIAILQQRLNEDIARLIVLQTELLDVWRERRQPEGILSIMELNSPQPCFIGSRLSKNRPIRRIDFRIESHDQGWASSRQDGTWSWFTVCVLPKLDTPLEGDHQTELGFANDYEWPLEQLGPHSSPGAWFPYRNDHQMWQLVTRERRLCQNTLACRDFEVHKVSWFADSDDPEEAAWVRSLEAGERIAVMAWARFAGWSNHISSVSVSLHTTPLI